MFMPLVRITSKSPTLIIYKPIVATTVYFYRTRVHSTLNITLYKMLYRVIPRSSDLILFASQPLREERLLVLEDK